MGVSRTESLLFPYWFFREESYPSATITMVSIVYFPSVKRASVLYLHCHRSVLCLLKDLRPP